MSKRLPLSVTEPCSIFSSVVTRATRCSSVVTRATRWPGSQYSKYSTPKAVRTDKTESLSHVQLAHGCCKAVQQITVFASWSRSFVAPPVTDHSSEVQTAIHTHSTSSGVPMPALYEKDDKRRTISRLAHRVHCMHKEPEKIQQAEQKVTTLVNRVTGSLSQEA
jgi:hypothetical protein